MEAVSFKNFSMKYTGSEFELRDINLTVNEGEFVIVCGLSGSGKSTLLRQVKKEFVSREYSGNVTVFGKEVKELELSDTLRTGYVMQFPREQTVTDNVRHELSFALENMGLSADEIRRRVSETAYYFGLDKYMDKKTCDLSGGELQILNLASVMAMRPDILLLDEPTSQLDDIAAEKFLSLVTRLNRELGITVIMAEHRLDRIENCTRTIILDKGRIMYDGGDPVNYPELPIYRLVGARLGKKINNIAECREEMKRIFKDSMHHSESVQPDEYTAKQNNGNGEVLIDVRNLWFRYTKNDRDILKGVNLTLMRGEVLGIIGGNGVGKSTLLTLMSGVRRAPKGKVNNQGNKIVYLPQTPLFRYATVDEELNSVVNELSVAIYTKERKNYRRSKERIKEELYERKNSLVNEFGLTEILKSYPYDISGGEKAKVAIVRALLPAPDVLLIDEPTKGLDIRGKEIVSSALMRLVNMGKGVAVVSHDIEFLAGISTRIATLFEGQIVSICTPELLIQTNYFYTTATSRITRGVIDGIITARQLEEVLNAKTEH